MEQLQKYISRITNFINELKENDPKYPNDTIHRKINRKLLKYKELKFLYEKTGIYPVFFLYILLICLIFIFIGFFDRILTIIIATAYPLYISYKTLQNHINDNSNDNEENEENENEDENINDMIQWLSYWVVYSFFINIESIFKRILIYIPFYFFIKVIFLLFCFLPQYQLSGWIYNNFIRVLFIKYEQNILNMSNQLIKTLTHSENDDNKNSEIKSDSYRKNDEKKDKRNKNNKKNVN